MGPYKGTLTLTLSQGERAYEMGAIHYAPRCAAHLQADQRPHKCCSGTLEVDVMAVDIMQALFCSVTRGFGTRPVDIFRPLGNIRQHGDMIVMHFHITTEDRQIPSLLALAIHQLALTEVGQERRVPRHMPR